MKKLIVLIVAAVALAGCGSSDSQSSETTLPPTVTPTVLPTCPEPYSADPAQSMRDLVGCISRYGKGIKDGFIVVAQGGPELLTDNLDVSGSLNNDYVQAIDGIGQEEVYYGLDGYNAPTETGESQSLEAWLRLAEANGIECLVTDYCSTQSKVDDSITRSEANGFISFQGHGGTDLGSVPPYPVQPHNVNANAVTSLSMAKNLLYIISPDNFSSKELFLKTVEASDYDLVITDLFYDGSAFSASDVERLQRKSNGATRLVICYVNIGAVENWRYYWQKGWRKGSPSWIGSAYEGWDGEWWTKYWSQDWRNIIYGSDQSYIKKAIDAGFDGVYLDNIIAYRQW